MKVKLKEGGAKITNLEAKVRTLNDAISIFGKLEKKYSEAIMEIERLNKLNESQRSIILKGKQKK